LLVPFLVFSIGLSHGAQKMNGIMQDIGRGVHRLVAARLTFRRLFVAGLTALLSDAVGFAVLMIIRIGVIQQLALMASVGVAVLIFTNLIFLPILLSYTGVSATGAQRSLRNEMADLSGEHKHLLWRFLDLFTHRKVAVAVIMLAAVSSLGALLVRSHLQVGDLDPGAPELRPDSRYNLDSAYVTANYAASSDVLVVMVKTPEGLCTQYDTLVKVDALEWRLQQLDGVESAASMATLSKIAVTGMNEGNLKWFELLANQQMLNAVTTRAPRELFNQRCDILSLFVFLEDHKSATLSRVVREVESFAAQNNDDQVRFLLAAGNAGIEAATNIVVKRSMTTMLLLVYGAVIILCFITFRSWRGVAAAVLPLMTTSVLCEALMVGLGIGVKVATLPVVALGVGIGVDYALYVLSILLVHLRQGMTLSAAYYRTLLFTGKVVILTGVTLSIGVATWAFSPIKFQADMGILLAFMFGWNMVGALVLMPSLARFLLIPKNKASEKSAVIESSAACITTFDEPITR
jgi:predicted RND superfamily exporter protein